MEPAQPSPRTRGIALAPGYQPLFIPEQPSPFPQPAPNPSFVVVPSPFGFPVHPGAAPFAPRFDESRPVDMPGLHDGLERHPGHEMERPVIHAAPAPGALALAAPMAVLMWVRRRKAT